MFVCANAQTWVILCGSWRVCVNALISLRNHPSPGSYVSLFPLLYGIHLSIYAYIASLLCVCLIYNLIVCVRVCTCPVVSIHPYRADAVEKLEEYHRRGVRMCKWLPNSMGIDLSHVKCHSFYDKMAELGSYLCIACTEAYAGIPSLDARIWCITLETCTFREVAKIEFHGRPII